MEILLIVGTVFFVLGVVLKLVQVFGLKISGENNAAKSALGFWGMQLIFAGILTAATGLFIWLHLDGLPVLFGGLIITLLIYTLIRGLKIKRSSGTVSVNTGLSWLGILATMIFAGAMVLYFLQDPAIVMKDKHFEVRGAAGIKVHLDDFKAITIENFIPKIVDMYDGVHIGDVYRGKFELYRTGTSLLYVDQPKSPYIFIFLKSKIGIVITRDNPEETRELYKEIREYWNHYLSTDVLNRLKKQYVK